MIPTIGINKTSDGHFSQTPIRNTTNLFAGARLHWKFVVGFTMFSLLFWLLEFFYLWWWVTDQQTGVTLIRSFAFAGATFFSWSLFSSALFKWIPRWAKYWPIRRALGVGGFVFIVGHVMAVNALVFKWDVSRAYPTWNPFDNPLVFGALAFPIFMGLTLTSTDWAMSKLGGARWKNIHRLVYLGYMLAVFHFLLVNPSALINLSGGLLIISAILALGGQLFWFAKIASGHHFADRGALIGMVIIGLYLIIGWLAFVAR